MKIANILATKGARVVTARPDQSLKEATMLLTHNKIGAVVVTDASGNLVGILSERDIIRAAATQADALALKIGDVMTRNVITGGPEDDLESVMATMTNRRFRHIPVMDHGKLAGIISIGDVVKNLLDNYEGEIATLQAQIIESQD